MLKLKDKLTDCWGDTGKVLSIEEDVVYLECIESSLCPEVMGEYEIIFLSDIE